MKIQNTSDLREMLISEIEVIQNGGDSKRAHSISMLAGKIIQSAKLDIDMMRYQEKIGGEGKTLKALELTK